MDNHKQDGLHTSFCHKCRVWMEFPYEQDGELYHKWCLTYVYLPVKIIETEMGNGMCLQSPKINSYKELQKVAQPELSSPWIMDEAYDYIRLRGVDNIKLDKHFALYDKKRKYSTLEQVKDVNGIIGVSTELD